MVTQPKYDEMIRAAKKRFDRILTLFKKIAVEVLRTPTAEEMQMWRHNAFRLQTDRTYIEKKLDTLMGSKGKAGIASSCRNLGGFKWTH
jgi:hypothetical protein